MGRVDKLLGAKQQQQDRMNYSKQQLEQRGYIVTEVDRTLLEFTHKGNTIKFYPYTGWHSGKGIKQGRGFWNLIHKLEK